MNITSVDEIKECLEYRHWRPSPGDFIMMRYNGEWIMTKVRTENDCQYVVERLGHFRPATPVEIAKNKVQNPEWFLK